MNLVLNWNTVFIAGSLYALSYLLAKKSCTLNLLSRACMLFNGSSSQLELSRPTLAYNVFHSLENGFRKDKKVFQALSILPTLLKVAPTTYTPTHTASVISRPCNGWVAGHILTHCIRLETYHKMGKSATLENSAIKAETEPGSLA